MCDRFVNAGSFWLTLWLTQMLDLQKGCLWRQMWEEKKKVNVAHRSTAAPLGQTFQFQSYTRMCLIAAVWKIKERSAHLQNSHINILCNKIYHLLFCSASVWFEENLAKAEQSEGLKMTVWRIYGYIKERFCIFKSPSFIISRKKQSFKKIVRRHYNPQSSECQPK